MDFINPDRIYGACIVKNTDPLAGLNSKWALKVYVDMGEDMEIFTILKPSKEACIGRCKTLNLKPLK